MNFSPEMMKMAADMMKNMSPEDFQRMGAMAGAAGGMPQAGAGDPHPVLAGGSMLVMWRRTVWHCISCTAFDAGMNCNVGRA